MKFFVVVFLCAAGILSSNAAPTDQNHNKMSAFDKLAFVNAVKTGNIDRFREMIKGHDINKKYGKHEKNTLHYVAEHGDEKIVDVAIQSGADVNMADKDGLTPLHYAAFNPNEKVTEILIKKGADVNKKNNGNNTPLHLAAINTNEKVIEQLLNNGADITPLNDEDETALHWASINPNEKVADLLIKKGIDLKPKNDEGNTALHTACLNSNEKVAELLIKAGAKVNAEGRDAWTPIFYAVGNGNKDLMTIMISTDEYDSYEKKKVAEIMTKHLEHPVHEGTNEKLIELLLNNGADINKEDSDDGTRPYDVAVKLGDKALTEFLTKHGATPKDN